MVNIPIKRNSKFRISAKRIYLTYSQVDKNIDSQHVLQEIKNKALPCFNYLIAKEFHQDGGIHFHVLLITTKKFDITNANALDITYQEHSYHGNYQAVRSLNTVVEYICKNGDYITDLTNLVDGKLLTLKQLLIRDVTQHGASQALIKHSDQNPNVALPNLSLSAAKKYFELLDTLKQSVNADQSDTPFTLKDFNLTDQLSAWVQNPSKTLILAGQSGVGKTAFCKAFVKDKNLNALFVNHKEDFKRLDSSYDCIIIDDANIHEIEQTQLLAILDNQVSKTLRVLYTTASKKPGITQIVAMNRNEFKKLVPILMQERFARRILFQQLKEPFIIKLNVNIQVNNISFSQNKEQEIQHIENTRNNMLNYLEETHAIHTDPP